MKPPSQEIWPRKPFERSLTVSDPEDTYDRLGCRRGSSNRGKSSSFDSDEDSEDEQVECCRGCTDYYYFSPIASPYTRENSCTKSKRETETCDEPLLQREDGSSLASYGLAELGQTCKIIFVMFLPLFARQFGVMFSRRVLGRFFGYRAV